MTTRENALQALKLVKQFCPHLENQLFVDIEAALTEPTDEEKKAALPVNYTASLPD